MADDPTPSNSGNNSNNEPQRAAAEPMTAERFAALWARPEVRDEERNWRPDMASYRNALMYLMGMRRPHYAVLVVPTYLQPVLIALFLSGHHIYVGATTEAGRVRFTIWRPSHPGENGLPENEREPGDDVPEDTQDTQEGE